MALIIFRGQNNEMLGNQFRLLQKAGAGSFGEVWKALRLSDGAVVALKIPRDQEKGEEVLRRESDIIRDIAHPNVVRILGYHTISELFVIEMEYVDGFDLGKVLDRVGRNEPLTYHRMLEWMLQMLNGLEAVHNAHISHNDLKPQNILIDAITSTAKLTDFGSSRRLEDVWVWTRGQGTEPYMAPEVALEGKRGKNVSDIYSLGVLLYEMTTGSLPYHSPHQLLSGMQVTRPREITRGIPADLEQIILKAMARNPEGRYQVCADMRDDIQACLNRLAVAQAESELPARSEPSSVGFRPPSTSPQHYLDLAKRCIAADDLHGALEAAEAAADRSDDHPQYLRFLAGICLRLQYVDKAIETYERVWAIYARGYPSNSQHQIEVLEQLGKLYITQQRYGDAVRRYETLAKLQGDRPLIKFRLAVALGLNGEYRRSIELLEQVRRERPNAVIVYGKLAWAHSLNGNDRLAVSFYNQALALDACDLFSLFHLGQYYLMTGDRRRARGYFDRLLDADRQAQYGERVRALLD